MRILFLLACLLAAWPARADLDYRLTLDIRPPVLGGTVVLSSHEAQSVMLELSGLQLLGEDGAPLENQGEFLRLDLSPDQPITLRYSANLASDQDNFVDSDNLFLTRDWYPQPDRLARYHFELSLPAGFIANSEAEQISFEQRGERVYYRFDFAHPLDALNLAASRAYRLKQRAYGGITLQAYFFQEDLALAETYLDHAQRYLDLYREMLGPYPYKRFAVVENRLPSGYSMPTYTLLGQSVARLPFIVETSLGHEILHQWLGNHVYVDYAQGNWAEGLTNYLADHWYAAQAGQDAAFRKRILLDYQIHARGERAFPLKAFHSRRDKAESAVGYGKGAMFFHALRRQLGDQAFFAGLRGFIERRRFRQANWEDLRAAFLPADLTHEFAQWLERPDIPELRIKHAALQMEYGGLMLRVSLAQNTPPYHLEIPLTVYSGLGKSSHLLSMNQAEQSFAIRLEEPPSKIVLDEDYHLMRALGPAEIPPVLAHILAEDKLLAAIPADRQALYRPLLDALGVAYEMADPGDLEAARIQANSLVLGGADSPLAALLLGRPELPAGGLSLRVFAHPRNPARHILLLDAANPEEIQAAARKLAHYGQYSALAFAGGQNTVKRTTPGENGLLLLQRPPTRALQPDSLPDLAALLPRLQDYRVIFVGEQHDRHAHHLNQLAIIRALRESGQPLAIGLEMFQKPAQAALDEYLAGQIEEKEFLRRSGYFDTWRFDYSLYKPILDYARANGIAVLALNVPGEINRKISREGIDSLDEAQKAQLPDALDFSDARYREDLQAIFMAHQKISPEQKFENFVQAQTVWDETMAETASRFLHQYPGHRLVILAGNGHLRYRYGIPHRLYRRTGAPYLVIAQDEPLAEGIADYVLVSEEIKGQPSPLLGVLIEEHDQTVKAGSVSPDSPAHKAGIEAGDILRAVAGETVRNLGDIKLALLGKRWGDKVSVTLERNGERLEKTVELFEFK